MLAETRVWSRSKLSPADPASSNPIHFPPLAVEARDLACVRGGRPVFSGVSFRVASGTILAVTGPNGAGKSSLLRILAGLLQPQAGRLALSGGGEEPVTHFLGHADALKPSLTLIETLRFWAALYGAPHGEALAAAVEEVGLLHALHLPTRVLSAGQRRRAALARLLIAPRPLWLLDEPGAALDKNGEALLARLIDRHLAAGGLAIAATHQPLPVPPHATLDLAAA